MTDDEFAIVLKRVVEQTGCTRFLETTDPTNPAYNPSIRESVILIDKGKIRETPIPPQGEIPPEPVPVPNADTPPMELVLATEREKLMLLVEACPYRGIRISCRCSTCSLGLGNYLNDKFRTSDDNCILCVQARTRPEDYADNLEYPSLWQQAKNLVQSALKFAASHFQVADRATVAHRLERCHGCTKHYDAQRGRCSACGCYVKFKAKVATEVCPIGEWERE